MLREFFFEAFDYVVELQKPTKVCFGSGLERTTNLIGRGLSPFQRRVTGELNDLAPGQYRVEDVRGAVCEQLKKYTKGSIQPPELIENVSSHEVFHLFIRLFNLEVRSRAGVGGLASKVQRFKERFVRTPSPGRYYIKTRWGEILPSTTPLGGRSKIREIDIKPIPGPGTYDLRKVKKCRRTRFMYNMGKPAMIPCVETNCIPRPVDKCVKCENLCKGDYWHKDHLTFLCQLCWNEEKRTREIYSEKELKEFKKIRNCSFMHRHEETTAAVRILSRSKINKKIRLENYLDLYLECDIPIKYVYDF